MDEFVAYQLHPVMPSILTGKYQQWKAKRALLGEFPPWDPNVAPFLEDAGITPPADSRPFFGEWNTKRSVPAEQEPKHDPILEDPINGESPYFFDEYGTLVCMPAKSGQSKSSNMIFDTDSGDVGVDNRCTACMSNVETDFVGDLIQVKKWVKGFNGSRVYSLFKGTIRWRITDNDGMTHMKSSSQTGITLQIGSTGLSVPNIGHR